MSLDLSAINAAVTAEDNQVSAIEAALTNLATQIKSNAADQTAVNAIADHLQQEASSIASTIAGIAPAPAPAPQHKRK